jgi:hypothetical protein
VNDDGEILFDNLATERGLSLTTTTLIKSAWAPETFRKMRHSWKLLYDFLKEGGLTYKALLQADACITVNNFKAEHEARQKTSIEALFSHANVILDVFNPTGVKLAALVNKAVKRKYPRRGRKYRTMWDITTLLKDGAVT